MFFEWISFRFINNILIWQKTLPLWAALSFVPQINIYGQWSDTGPRGPRVIAKIRNTLFVFLILLRIVLLYSSYDFYFDID